MELQLCLALVPPYTPMKGFDLNTTWAEQEEKLSNCTYDSGVKQKPFLDGAIWRGQSHSAAETSLFPLVSWNGLPNEEDDDRNRGKERTSNTSDNDDGNQSRVVGWPPIKSLRKKLLHGHGHEHQVGRITDHRMAAVDRGTSLRTKSMYVKVKMEGVGIAKKIDLRLYRSYHTLTTTLISMFTKSQQIDKDGAHYTLLYQDNEGDWLFVGDVPWHTFIESVQRMEILKNVG